MLAVIHIRRNQDVEVELVRAVVSWRTDGGAESRLFTHDDASDASYYGAGLDAFALLLEISVATSEPILLHVTDNTLRKEIGAVVDAFPSVTIVGVARGAIMDLTLAALDVLDADDRERQAAAEERERARIAALPELTVATDASKSRRRGVGVACVSEEGNRHQKMIPGIKTVVAGELLAIELAIDRFIDRRLHILTDSQAALQYLGVTHPDRPLPRDGEATAVADRIRHSLIGREVRFSWVRGHNGHLLNETADRLAVAARRAYEAQIPTETRKSIADRIVEPLLAAA
ncbi:ribonuclease H family protein [Prescottella agglutinans]|uniref:ribonuclease H family protein n=1 Tax=Prescottella agglutinans TaxID=1644129 RepID=UPI003D99D342